MTAAPTKRGGWCGRRGRFFRDGEGSLKTLKNGIDETPKPTIRRVYFGIWTIISLLVLPRFNFVLPAMIANVLFPRDSTWKRRLLYVIYIPLSIVFLIPAFLCGISLYLVFALTFVLFALKPAHRATVLPIFLAIPLFLLLAGPLYVSLGFAGSLISAVLCFLAAYFLVRAKILGQAADIPVHLCLINAMFIVWFYFIPAPYPSSLVLAQKGVSNIASFDTSAELRKTLQYYQTNFVDEYSRDSLLVGTKRHLASSGFVHRYLLIDKKPGYNMREVKPPRDFTAVQLLRCGGSEPASQRSNEITLGAGRPPLVDSELSPPETGFCIERTHTLVLGDDFSLYIFDVDNNKILLQDHVNYSFVLGLLPNVIAPYGGGKLYYLRNRRFPMIGSRQSTGQPILWKPADYKIFPIFWGEDKLLGNEDLDSVLLFRKFGSLSKIDPESGREIQAARIMPGMRFGTIDMKMRLVFVVNEWLG
jgi:hypothetical protein